MRAPDERAASLLELEQRLANANPDDRALADLLADDFCEFGASGRVWAREATIAGVLTGGRGGIRVCDFVVALLAEAVALATWHSETGDGVARRPSLWVLRDGRWQLGFHQGTAVPREA